MDVLPFRTRLLVIGLAASQTEYGPPATAMGGSAPAVTATGQATTELLPCVSETVNVTLNVPIVVKLWLADEFGINAEPSWKFQL